MGVLGTFSNIVALVRVRSWPSFMLCFLGGLSFSNDPFSELYFKLLDGRRYVSFFAFTLLLAYTFALNQCFDRKEDSLHDEKRWLPVSSGQMSVSTALGLSLMFLAAGSAVMSSVSYSPPLVLLYVLVWTVYSIPKLRFKERIGLDLISNGVGGGLSFLLGSSVQSPVDLKTSFVAGIIVMLYGSGYAFHSCADYETDKLAGVKTTCVRTGRRMSLLSAAIINATMGVLFVVGVVLLPFPRYYLILTAFLVPLFLLIAKADVENADSLKTLQRRVVYIGYAMAATTGVIALLSHFFS